MPISNVQQNKIDAIKLNLSTNTRQASANKPEYLQMTGSIFNAPGAKSTSPTTTANSLNDLNTRRSIDDLNNSGGTTGTAGAAGGASDSENITDIDNAADGRAAAADAQSQGDQVESLTHDM